jgi:hypothetical protein
VIAVLPEDYRPAVTRTVLVASDARKPLLLDLTASGQLTIRVAVGGTTKATWISLDGIFARLDAASDD